MYRISIFTVVLTMLCAPAWAVNKCTGVDGSVTYQETACEGAKKINLSGAGQADLSSPVTNQWKRVIARQAHEEKVASAIANREVFIGMTADDARQSWGAPNKINTSIGSYGKHEQWVYDRERSRAQYVYIENGKVTSIQSPQ